ncbi:hypothetical protein D3C72_1644390 [compost metagenome]
MIHNYQLRPALLLPMFRSVVVPGYRQGSDALWSRGRRFFYDYWGLSVFERMEEVLRQGNRKAVSALARDRYTRHARRICWLLHPHIHAW